MNQQTDEDFMNLDVVSYSIVESPLGAMILAGTSAGLIEINFIQGRTTRSPDSHWRLNDQLLSRAIEQLRDYFQGNLREFDLPLDLRGTPFQVEVWTALKAIPYGVTISYAELARRVGRPSAVRAVGAANGKNPISIVVPCHRVIGSNGSLTGYGGGIEKKAALLELEQARTVNFRAQAALF
jgi:methylated-DNA-[protein]-cysteine S-methyltransferase